MSTVTLNHITKTYNKGQVVAVDDVSFDVKDGAALEKFFIRECAGDGKPSPKIFGTPLKHD